MFHIHLYGEDLMDVAAQRSVRFSGKVGGIRLKRNEYSSPLRT